MKSAQQSIRSSDLESKKDFIPLLEMFMDQKYGEEVWDAMLLNKKFNELVIELYPKYGNMVFQEVVNFICDANSLKISVLLNQFSKFVNFYYSK